MDYCYSYIRWLSKIGPSLTKTWHAVVFMGQLSGRLVLRGREGGD